MLDDKQVGVYGVKEPTHCAVSGVSVGAGATQFSVDEKHYVLVASTYVRKVTEEMRETWRKQFKTSPKVNKKEVTDVSDS